MVTPEDPVFEQFVAQRKSDLQRISRHTQGEHQLSDVVNEAWLVAHGLKSRNSLVDFLSRSFQDLLISYVYQRLVRYTEQNVRRALRLDHATPYEEHDDRPHPVTGMLASDQGKHPLEVLLEQEARPIRDTEIDVHHSQASAYVHLLRRFNNRMPAVADYLLISVSYAYRRCARVRFQAIHQNPAPLAVMDAQFIPSPWRRFRVQRVPEQQVFDFEEELPLIHHTVLKPFEAS